MKRTAHTRSRIKNIELSIKGLILDSYSFILFSVRCALNASSGFTLIEILVAFSILATLVGGVLVSINPIGQISKGQDAQKMTDLQAIKTALDLYYNDKKCYPKAEDGLVFGSEWTIGSTVYMKKIPQDPKCAGGGSCYRYRTVVDPNDPSYNCPQWNVVFAQLSKAPSQNNACALSSLSSCVPSGYTSNPWACVMSGAVSCNNLLAVSVDNDNIASFPDPTVPPTLTPGVTITTTPTPPPEAGSVTYTTSDNGVLDAYEVTISPLFQVVGQSQQIQVKVDAPSTVTTVNVKVILYSDGEAREFDLPPPTNVTIEDDVWNGTFAGSAWAVTDTYNQIEGKQYGYDIIVTDNLGNTDTDYIRIE